MKSAERYDLAKTKYTESLAEYLFTHIVKYGVIILKEVAHVVRKKKRIPDFDHTYCVQGLNITTSQNSITENGNRLNSLYWYKAIVRCTHLVARILQHGCKFCRWLKVNKISNQTVHHQSATKFDSMLQDIKKLQAYKTKNTFCISDIAQKKKLLIFLIMSIQTD